jgi:hypothetical protein
VPSISTSEREREIDRISAVVSSSGDDINGKLGDAYERFDASGNQVESCAQFARDYEPDIDEGEEYAEATTGDDEAEYRLGLGSVKLC